MTNHWHFGLLPVRCQRPRARRVIDQQYAFGLLPITSSARTRRAVGLFRRRLFWPLEIYDQLVLRRLLNGRSPGLAPCEISPLPVAWALKMDIVGKWF
jgi:hypothetical protein